MRRKIALYLMFVGIGIVASALWMTNQTSLAASDIPTHPVIIPQQDDGEDETDTQTETETESEGEVDSETDAQGDAESEADGESLSNDYCLLCHSQPNRITQLPSGETLQITVDPEIFAASVHGEMNPDGELACVECHGDYRYPHPPIPADTIREYRLEHYNTCQGCHEDQYSELHDSVHGVALAAGQVDAPTCVDCHGAHDVQPADEPRERISLTCGQCHGAIFDEYRVSVHGESLFRGNEDVPTCTDCHGVHGIQNPTTAQFRVRSPQLCADCHADEEMMGKYDITTDVFDTYLTDFHGTTVALFDQLDPHTETNKAVCYDCHGVHNITPADNFKSQVAKENLLATCQQCHPDATGDFPDAWVGHFPPTAGENPALFAVTWFYKIIIPLTIGGFLFLVGTDVFGRIRRRLSGSGH